MISGLRCIIETESLSESLTAGWVQGPPGRQSNVFSSFAESCGFVGADVASVMAVTPAREWTALQQLPVGTQTAVPSRLGKLRQQVKGFQGAFDKAGVTHRICIYYNEGRAFWTSMDQIHRVDGPQRKPWIKVPTFFAETSNIGDDPPEGATKDDAGANLEEGISTEGRISNLKPSDGVVIVDHGSRRAQSNEMLHQFVELYKQKIGHSIVEAAHMELAEPSISHAFDRCVEQGAKRVIICPYFFFPGRHWDRDIPGLASKAEEKYAGTPYIVTAPIGVQELMVQVMTDRMEYCLSRVAGNVEECDMCKGTNRCQQLVAAYSSQQVQDKTNK